MRNVRHARSEPAGVVWHALAAAICFGSCRVAAASFCASRCRAAAVTARTRVASASRASRAGTVLGTGAADSSTRDGRLESATPATQHRLRIGTAASAGRATC